MSEPLYLQLVPSDLNLEPLGTIVTLYQKKINESRSAYHSHNVLTRINVSVLEVTKKTCLSHYICNWYLAILI